MLSCAAPPAPAPPAAAMPPAHHPAWRPLLHPSAVKDEPVETCDNAGAFSKENGSGFLSEGFHSASPSSSSKDSQGHSPRSVSSGGQPSPTYYDRIPLHAKMNIGLHLDSYQNNVPYSLLTPPGYDNVQATDARLSPGYDRTFSPKSLLQHPANVSTPVAKRTPPKSPSRLPSSPECPSGYERFHDSGFQTSRGEGCDMVKGEPGTDEQDSHDGSGGDDMEFEEEPGLRMPAVNSHGKVKTFKCKQCEFVAVTKLSFWEHTKEHIKPEKMLTCPKCPFVTEYKHHLEYHMRNHFGSKPFQCNQCSYSCVNKSMLNSHLKSHSNVYQYRCADCNYATKYCHSLKLHLRKYQHSPAMVLNHDGTPNPLPIIDVYGTRRGPKQKPLSKVLEAENPPPPPAQPQHPLFHSPFAINFPYGSLLPHPFLFPPNNNYGESKVSPRRTDSPSEDSFERSLPATILQQRLSYGDRHQDSSGPRSPVQAVSSPVRSSPTRPESPRTPPRTPVASIPVNDALDLTSSKQSDSSPSQPAPLTPTTAMKNRRKGRAFKLQPAALRLQHATSEEGARPLNTNAAEISESESDGSAGETPAVRPRPPSVTVAAVSYDCQFCDISFKDLTMHTIHMGFHGYNDPFMCNKCGERSADKVSFFIHLGRAEHA